MTLVKPDICCRVNPEALLRRLGITGDTSASGRCRQTLAGLAESAKLWAKPLCYYMTAANTYALPEPELERCGSLVLCFATLGPRISGEIAGYFSGKDYLKGYLLDCLGSELLFEATEKMNAMIEARLRERGLYLTLPFFPGEGNLALSRQSLLLAEMQKQGNIPAAVNEHCVLIPGKSVLYVFGADAGIIPGDIRHDCSRCQRETCRFRRKEEKGEGLYQTCFGEGGRFLGE